MAYFDDGVLLGSWIHPHWLRYTINMSFKLEGIMVVKITYGTVMKNPTKKSTAKTKISGVPMKTIVLEMMMRLYHHHLRRKV